MKAQLKTILVAGLGLVSVAAIAYYTLFPKAVVSSNRPETTIAQAPRGTALASQLQGKPTIVKIYADWCSACQRLQPVTESLQQQFGEQANFVIFDVSNRSTTQAAEAKARELGLSDFLATYRSQTSTVAIINPSNGQILRQFRYNFNQQDYVNGIQNAIAQIRA
jgi:thiol-disulfide isomerase/thioredoxin